MSVYVDDFFQPYGQMLMCHMVADTSEELHAMAEQIGVARRWIQHQGTNAEHYDVCKVMRERAIALGAVPVTRRVIVAFLQKKRAALKAVEA